MELKLNRKARTLAVDNTAVLTKHNGSADILFLQMVNEGPTPEADVVAAVRLSTMSDLEELHRVIGEAIEKHKKSEK
jgi:Asp-tRNA(Asn)/Glu-tRNA(Gln) amidotransferase B subunit